MIVAIGFMAPAIIILIKHKNIGVVYLVLILLSLGLWIAAFAYGFHAGIIANQLLLRR